MDKKIKQIVKEAVLEALCEFTNGGVSTLSVGDVPPPVQNPTTDDPDGESGNDGDSGNNGHEPGSGSENSSGGGLNNGRPIPDVGVGGWSLR